MFNKNKKPYKGVNMNFKQVEPENIRWVSHFSAEPAKQLRRLARSAIQRLNPSLSFIEAIQTPYTVTYDVIEIPYAFCDICEFLGVTDDNDPNCNRSLDVQIVMALEGDFKVYQGIVSMCMTHAGNDLNKYNLYRH